MDEYVALFCPNCGAHVNEDELDNDHGYDKKQLAADTWTVNCEHCPWTKSEKSRRKAVTAGHNHIAEDHDDDDEWSFRVRGFHRTTTHRR